MTSRFFKHFSESESESSEAESESAVPTKNLATVYSFSDDDEEETKRVVKSAKEKRYEELQNLIKQARNHKKNLDIAKVLDGFEEICIVYSKAKNFFDKENDNTTPRLYIRYLSELDQFTNDLWNDKEVKKNMSKNNSKSLGILRQKLRKYIKDFENEIEAYRENPDTIRDDVESDEETDEESQNEKDDDLSSDEGSKVKSKFLKKGSDDEFESWDSEDEESTSSSDDDGEDLRSKFLKHDAQQPKEITKKKKEKKEKVKEIEKKDVDEGKWEKVGAGLPTTTKPKLFAKSDNLTHNEVLNKVYEVLAMRGKRKIQRSEQLRMLNEILAISKKQNLGPALEIKILIGIITSLFDYNPSIQLCIRQSLWLKCLKYCILLLDKLQENPDVFVGDHINEDKESYHESPYYIHGSIVGLIERMDVEFTRILQAADAHSPEYIEKLKFESVVEKIIIRLQQYLEEKNSTDNDLCRAYLLRIHHLYYKYDHTLFENDKDKENKLKQNFQFEIKLEINDENKENQDINKEKIENNVQKDSEHQINEKDTEENIEKDEKTQDNGLLNDEKKKKQVDKLQDLKIEIKQINEKSLQTMDRLCKFIYSKDTTGRIRTQAILYHIYHHALHDNWFEARDLMLMSQLQHNINKADIPLHIIYNRALIQLGLCAFRHGFIWEALTDLLDIQLLGRAKELLAQGILPKLQERTLEQEKAEKQRLLPFHMHINLELLECVYLVSAMLLEIPDVAANEYNVRKKIITRPFYNQLRKNEEQPLVGVPESMREHVIAASKAMRVGNWKQCQKYIINEKMNNKVWNLFHRADKVRGMLKQKIKEQSLRAYLFTYSHVYDSISLLTLEEIFQLDSSIVHSFISKMIIREELMASLDEPSYSLVMHRTEPSRVQGLSLQLIDKINLLVDCNEKLYEIKQNTGNLNRQQNKRSYNDHKNNDQNRNKNNRDNRRKRYGQHRNKNQNEN